MEIVKNYNEALQALYDHVGFVEDWVVYAIEDRTEMLWCENGEAVRFAKTFDELNSSGDYYENEIYKQRFYEKHVFRGEKLTMIIVDTHVDGNKFFAVYDNTKEITLEI